MSKVANIKLSGGIINTPSDVSPIDGDLNECINLVPSDGELKPVEMPAQVFSTGGPAGIVSAIHSGVWGKNFVKVDENKNDVWFLTQDMQFISVIGFNSKIKWIQCLGLFVIVGTETSIEYIFYNEGVYTNLGQRPHLEPIDFYIKDDECKLFKTTNPKPSILDGSGNYIAGLPVKAYCAQGSHATIVECYPYRNFETEPNFEEVYDNILENISAKIAKTTTDIRDESRFIYPFFIRSAIKLKTGEYISHSQPILLLPSTEKNPILFYYEESERHQSGGEYRFGWNPVVEMTGFRVHFKFDSTLVDKLELWKDMIESVDFFITRPLYSYKDSDMKADKLFPGIENWGNNYGTQRLYPRNNIDIGKWVSKTSFENLLNKHTNNRTIVFNNDDYEIHINGEYGFDLPAYTMDKQKEVLMSEMANFYRVKSYSIEQLDELKDGENLLEIEEDVLNTLEQQTALSNDLHDGETFMSECACIYNGRLILGNKVGVIQQYYQIANNNINSINVELKFFLTMTGKNIIQHVSYDDVNRYMFGSFIYHPYKECHKVYVKINSQYYSCIMKPHVGINGAYFFCGYQPFENVNPNLVEYISQIDAYTWNLAVGTDLAYQTQNIIMVSGVASPTSFDQDNMLEVGRGNIYNIATNALPMSPGQFGQHPIVIFTDNGIYSIGIKADGTLADPALVSSADTLIGFPKLGQPNVISDGQSLYFTTKRGLMELRGLQVRCVSEILNGRKWESKDYPNSVAVDGPLGIQNCVTLLAYGITDQQTFNQMIEDGDAFLAFDYKHNRILVTDPTRQSHYLYAISSGKWSKLMFGSDFDNFNPTNVSFINITQHIATNPGNDRTSQQLSGRQIVSAVFDYNRSYLQMRDGSIYDLMGAPDENNDPMYKFGFVATRPMRFGTDDYKTLKKLLHRQRIDRVENPQSIVAIRLYGSVDSIKWYELRHLRGAAYKYYAVLLYTCMKANERYSYMSVEFEEKFQNKLR